jgi:hypothetical protein
MVCFWLVVCGLRSSLSCWALRQMEECDMCVEDFDGGDLYDHDGARWCLSCHLFLGFILMPDDEVERGLPLLLSMSLVLQIAILQAVGLDLLDGNLKTTPSDKTTPSAIYVIPPTLTPTGRKSTANPCHLFKDGKFGKQAINYIVRAIKEYVKKRQEEEEKRVKDYELNARLEENLYITNLLKKVIQTPIPFSADLIQVPSDPENDEVTYQFNVNRKEMLEYLTKSRQSVRSTSPPPSTDFLEKFDRLLANTTTIEQSIDQ